MKYVFKDFPLESIHPAAFKAHEAANCAEDEGKYHEMHDRIMENPKAVSADDLTKHAEAIGLNVDSFKECLDSGKHSAAIRKDMSEASKAGIRGTPSFLIGVTDPNDTTKVKATKMLRGAVPYAQFQAAFDELLASD